MKKDRTLLDRDGIPTIEEMKEYFQKHDFTTVPSPVDYGKLTLLQRNRMGKVAEMFKKSYLNNLKQMGGKSSFRNFSADYPARLLEQVDAELIAGILVQIYEDDELYKSIISAYFDAMRETHIAAIEAYVAASGKQVDELSVEECIEVVDQVAGNVDNKMIWLMMQVQGVPEILQITKENSAHEDFNKNAAENYSMLDHLRRWNHSDTKAGAPLSLDRYLEDGEPQYEMDITDIVFEEFLASLNETDRSIMLLHKEGVKLQKIADLVGYKTHSAVSKRLKFIKQRMEEFYR